MIPKYSKHQAQTFIRNAAKSSERIIFTDHADKQMKKRKISRVLALDCLRTGKIHRTPEPNIVHGSLECRMEAFVAGMNLAVVVALSAEDPDCIVVTAWDQDE